MRRLWDTQEWLSTTGGNKCVYSDLGCSSVLEVELNYRLGVWFLPLVAIHTTLAATLHSQGVQPASTTTPLSYYYDRFVFRC